MSLKEYKKRRNFKRTPEPSALRNKISKIKKFVVQKHFASTLHYDLRLEMRGILKSWAVPKGIPQRTGIKKLAVQTENHPIAYLNFKGVIPEGEYGAGRVEIWDRGNYQMIKKTSVSYKFKLSGNKLKGIYVLYNFKDKNWFLFKTSQNKKDSKT